MEIRTAAPRPTVGPAKAPVAAAFDDVPVAKAPGRAGDVADLATDTDFQDAAEVALDDIQVEDAAPADKAAEAKDAAGRAAVAKNVKEILGRAPTEAELTKLKGLDEKAMRRALVNTAEFEAKAKQTWASWGKANSNTKLTLDPARLKRLKDRVAEKGESVEKAVGFLYSGGALTNMMMAKYFRQVEEESQRRRARGG